MSIIKQSIEQLTANAQERNLDIKGDPEGLWFIVGKVRLDHRFNVSQTDVMVKFEKDSKDPTILIPEEVSVRPNAGISDSFIEPYAYVEDWNCVFPNLFLDVNGELIELIFSVAGILGNLALYDLVRPDVVANEIIAEFVDSDETDNSELNGSS